MRVYDERGQIVKLIHFRFSHRSLVLLQELQRQQDSCNMPIVVESRNTRYSTPLFKLVLDQSTIILLNPNETQTRRAS